MEPAILFFERFSAALYRASEGSTDRRRLLHRVSVVTNTPSARQAAVAYLLGYAAASGYQVQAASGATPHLQIAAELSLGRLRHLVTPSASAAA